MTHFSAVRQHSCNPVSGRWVVIGNVVIGTVVGASAPVLTVSSPIEIQGNLVVVPPLNPTTITTSVAAGAVVTVQGCVSLSGTLEVRLSNSQAAQSQVSVDVMSYQEFCNDTQTAFSNVTVSGASSCAKASATQATTSRLLSVVITIDSSGCNPPNSGAALENANSAAIGAGVGVPLALILIGGIIAFIVIRRRRKPEEKDDLDQLEMATNGAAASGGAGAASASKSNSGKKRKTKGETEYGAFSTDIQQGESANVVTIPSGDVKMLHKLGSGAYGDVYLACMPDGSFVAVKQLSKAILAARVQDFFEEANIMLQLEEHRNLVETYGIVVDSGQYGLVMEFVPGGSLETLLTNASNAEKQDILVGSESELFFIIYGIVCGMESLANSNIVHRDLSARNVLLDEQGLPKISDFGYARRVGAEQVGKTESNLGPIRWMDPQAIKSRTYSEASDVWAFGATICEILTGQLPYPDMENLADIAVAVRDSGLTPLAELKNTLKAQSTFDALCFLQF